MVDPRPLEEYFEVFWQDLFDRLDKVFFVDVGPRMDDGLGKGAVIGDEEESRSIFVEASYCKEALGCVGEKVENNGIFSHPYIRANDAEGFMEEVVYFFFFASDFFSVHFDRIALPRDESLGDFCHSAVDEHPSFKDELFCFPARCDARGCERFGETFFLHGREYKGKSRSGKLERMQGKLILLRHGKSAWNQKNIFTGWVDVPLSQEGVEEALAAGPKLFPFRLDRAFTSTLVRAHMTLSLALLAHPSQKIPVFLRKAGKEEEIHSEEAKKGVLFVEVDRALNERMYGDLQGCNKEEMAALYGKEQVQLWRRSFRVAPPHGESLEDTSKRTLPYFRRHIAPLVQRGETILVVAHGNSLRSIVMDLEELSEERVVSLEIPTGEPWVYLYEEGRWHRQKSC